MERHQVRFPACQPVSRFSQRRPPTPLEGPRAAPLQRGLGRGGGRGLAQARGRETPQGFGSALIRVIITAEMHIHRHTHTGKDTHTHTDAFLSHSHSITHILSHTYSLRHRYSLTHIHILTIQHTQSQPARAAAVCSVLALAPFPVLSLVRGA